MANPQKENGFTMIADEIIDALIDTKISGQELRVILFVIRKTYGYGKTKDFISLSQFGKNLNISITRASQIVNGLEKRKILTVTQNINGIGKEYKFNKDFDSWGGVNKNINPLGKTIKTLKKKRNKPLRKSESTIDSITKDTITIDNGITYETFKKSFLKNLNISITNDKNGKLIFNTYGDEKCAEIMANIELYFKKEIPKREFRIAKRWNKIFENIDIFLDRNNTYDRMADEKKWGNKDKNKKKYDYVW